MEERSDSNKREPEAKRTEHVTKRKSVKAKGKDSDTTVGRRSVRSGRVRSHSGPLRQNATFVCQSPQVLRTEHVHPPAIGVETIPRRCQLTGRLVQLLLAPGCGWRYQSDWLPVIRGVLE